MAQRAEVLDPAGQPARQAATVRAEWQQVLDRLERESARASEFRDLKRRLLSRKAR